MIEQSKTHPFNLSKEVKIFLPCIMEKGNKVVIFYFVFESFLSNFIESKSRDTVDLGEGTPPPS